MKVVAKNIDMIAWFKEDGRIRPLKFRMEIDGRQEVVRVDQVIASETEKLAGNIMQRFECQSEMDGVIKRYQIKYEVSSGKWILFKI